MAGSFYKLICLSVSQIVNLSEPLGEFRNRSSLCTRACFSSDSSFNNVSVSAHLWSVRTKIKWYFIWVYLYTTSSICWIYIDFSVIAVIYTIFSLFNWSSTKEYIFITINGIYSKIIKFCSILTTIRWKQTILELINIY